MRTFYSPFQTFRLSLISSRQSLTTTCIIKGSTFWLMVGKMSMSGCRPEEVQASPPHKFLIKPRICARMPRTPKALLKEPFQYRQLRPYVQRLQEIQMLLSKPVQTPKLQIGVVEQDVAQREFPRLQFKV